VEKKTTNSRGKSIVRTSDTGRLLTRRDWKPTAADKQLKKAWGKTYSNRNQKKAS